MSLVHDFVFFLKRHNNAVVINAILLDKPIQETQGLSLSVKMKFNPRKFFLISSSAKKHLPHSRREDAKTDLR